MSFLTARHPYQTRVWTNGETEGVLPWSEWKLVYFGGMRPQLFDLESDPHEFHDLGEDPDHKEVRDKLVEKVLQGWSAEQVTAELAYQGRDQAIITRWYKRVNPPPPPTEWLPPPNYDIFPM